MIAILFENASTVAVMATFWLEVCSGFTPDLRALLSAPWLAFPVLVSPNRWAQGYLFKQHFTGRSFNSASIETWFPGTLGHMPGSIWMRSTCSNDFPLSRWR